MSRIYPSQFNVVRFSAPFIGLVMLATSCTSSLPGDEAVPTLSVRVVNTYPHDPAAFTQGLVVEGNTLYEGTGQYGNSALRKVDLESGKSEIILPLGKNYFGEGITAREDYIYQLTWKERVCIVYEKATLRAIGTLRYTGEGWGLTHDGESMYLSDGTSTIRVLDPKTFRVQRRIRVKEGRRNIDKLNELEFVDGHILANIWYSDRIAKIDPQTGAVVAWIDCRGVYPATSRPSREHVLNGIALDEESGRLFITGKNWPNLFEIEILSSP